MLEEVKKVAQQKGVEGYRRWFADEEMDLIIWYTPAGQVSGFELCYDKNGDEHAFTWRRGGKLTHVRIDPGEDLPTDNRSPIIVPDGQWPGRRVLREFRERAKRLEHEVAELVIVKLKASIVPKKR